VIETEGGGTVNPIVAIAVLVASARLVAVKVTFCAVAIVAGAVYKPALETEPGPLRDQDTPVLLDPVTVAVNCCVCEAVRLTLEGLRVIETGGGGALLIVTEISAVAWLPTVSNTTADRLCFPFATDCEFQLTVYGDTVTGAPMGRPSTRN
jgi:hypothetical protein